MRKLTVKTPAKINLILDVTGKLPNGYHTIESIFQTVDIFDVLTVELTDSGIELTCTDPEIPCDERNIAHKAACLFAEYTGKTFGCRIHIEKHIPSQAGMGGGSSDGAAVIYALDRLLDTKLTDIKMIELGVRLGADVPYFFYGGTAWMGGIGEELYAQYRGCYDRLFVIAKGKEGVSTAEAYRKIDELVSPHYPPIQDFMAAIMDGTEYDCFRNIFEQVIDLKEVSDIKTVMTQHGGKNPTMTGSGSAVFGLFDRLKSAAKCRKALSELGYYAEICQTINETFVEC